MKKIIIMLVALLSVNLVSQDRMPNLKSFNTIKSNSQYLLSNDNDFKQKNILLGWHWDGNPYFNDSLRSNHCDASAHGFIKNNGIHYHNKFKNTVFTMQPDINSTNNWERFFSHYEESSLFHFKSLQFEAGLNTQNKNNYKNYGDVNNPVFGFRTRSGGILIEENGNKLLKFSNVGTGIILKDVYPNKLLKESNYMKPPADNASNDDINNYLNYCENYNGRFLYLAIRIKCLDPNIDLSFNTPVLSIRLPFYKGVDTTYLKFSNLPDPSHSAVDIVRSNDINNSVIMGRRRRLLDTNAVNEQTLIITKRMLMSPNSNHSDYTNGFSSGYRSDLGYITIYAKIIFNGDLKDKAYFQNRYKDDSTQSIHMNSGTINDYDKFDIEVTSLNTADFAIDWIRLETPHTHKVLWGQKNQEISDAVNRSFIPNTQAFRDKNNQILRLVSIVEGTPMTWDGLKYLRQMCGDIFTAEDECPYQPMYQHYVGMQTSWLGLFKLLPTVARPFIKFGFKDYPQKPINTYFNPPINDSDKEYPAHWTGGFGRGAYGTYLRDKKRDSLNYYVLKNLLLNSAYETYDTNMYTLNYNETQYRDIIRRHYETQQSFQAYYEHHTQWHYNDNFLNTGDNDEFDRGKGAGFIYGKKDWWGQTFNLQQYGQAFKTEYKNNLEKSYCNALTAEELRLIQNNYMIMGAKGILLDGLTWGHRKNVHKLVQFDAWDDPLDTIKLNPWGYTSWYKWERANKLSKNNRWASQASIAKYGLVRNPEIGGDYYDKWFKDIALWGGYADSAGNNSGVHFYRNEITDFDLTSNDARFPPIPSFSSSEYDTTKAYKTISKLMGLRYDDNDDDTRIYMGMRSQRTEVMKINRYLSTPEVDNTLMNAKLAGWLGKGFRKVMNYDSEEFDTNPLNYILDVNNVKTYKIWSFHQCAYELYTIPWYQSEQTNSINLDSGFYDITLLRKTNPKIIDNLKDDRSKIRGGFVLCVQNRRTDPLTIDSWLSTPAENNPNESRTIRHFELTNDELDVFSRERINFLSQAEYDDRLIKTPNYFETTARENYNHFAKMYWTKFGARRIVIPMKKGGDLGNITNAEGITLRHWGYKVRELGDLDTELNKEYWRNGVFCIKPRMHNNLYPPLNGQQWDRAPELYLDLQPGEAKYLWVEPIYATQYSEEQAMHIGCEFDYFLKVPDNANYYTLASITSNIQTNTMLHNLPISLQVLDTTVAYQIESIKGGLPVYKEIQINKNIKDNKALDTNTIFVVYPDSLKNGDKLQLCNLYFTSKEILPVKISYYYEVEKKGLIIKDTIIYIENSLHFKASEQSTITNINVKYNPDLLKFDLQFDSNNNQFLQMSITDNSGKNALPTFNFDAKSGTNLIQINADSIPEGNYILMIQNSNNKITKEIKIAN